MHSVSHDQLRAARALLDFDQKDVAEESGINVNVISRIERGEVNPQERTREKLLSFYQQAGIEFVEGDGVRRRRPYVQMHRGAAGFRAFMDDVYETAKAHGGDICLFNSKPSLWHDWLGEEWYAMHAARMKALGKRIRVRIAVPGGEKDFILDTAEHRWLKKELAQKKIFYAYGPKLAFLDFEAGDVQIVVFTQSEFAEIFRAMFDIAWERETRAPG